MERGRAQAETKTMANVPIMILPALFLSLLLLPSTFANHPEIIAKNYIENGVEVPYTRAGAITCIIPGLNWLYCMGPRVQAIKPSETVYGRQMLRNGWHNGVDLRFLKLLGIQRKSEFGRTIGAGFGIGPNDGEVEWGDRIDVADQMTYNRGGNVAFDHHGVGVEVGDRMQLVDHLLHLHNTQFGVEYGDRQRPPFRRVKTHGADLRPPATFESFYPGYKYSHDWYHRSFKRIGDEARTPYRAACPWCYGNDGILF